MYKLLTTAAVIMTVATPSFAWDGAKDLTLNLETIYQNLNGQPHFDGLVGNGGALDNLYSEIDQGVTHITLATNTDKQISIDVHEGTTLTNIIQKGTDLVSQVNYDLFVDDDLSTVEVGVGTTSDGNYITDGGIIDGSQQYANQLNAGLVGRQIGIVVQEVNDANDYLTETGRTDGEAQIFVDQINNYNTDGSQTGGVIGNVDFDQLFTTIDGLNVATATASTTDTYFGELNSIGIDGTTLNNFAIPNYSAFNEIGVKDDVTGHGLFHTSISDWAHGVYNYATANGGAGTITDGGTVTVDVAANTVSYGGKTYNVAADGTLTEV